MICDDVTARRTQVRETGLLSFLQIRKNCARRLDRGVVVFKADATGGGKLPLPPQFFARVVSGKLPSGTHGDRFEAQHFDALRDVVRLTARKFGDEYLCGLDPRDLVE